MTATLNQVNQTAEPRPEHAQQILPPAADDWHDMIAHHRDWLATRRTGIGSSDASTLVGLNRYRSRYELWLDKTGQLPIVLETPSESAEMGTLLEPIVRDRFARIHQLTITPAGTWRSTRWPWMLANPDGFCSDGAGYEGKTTSAWLAHEWDDEQVPDHAELQAQWCMAVTGFSRWHVAVCIGGQRNEYRLVERDEELISQLVEISGRFWREHVETGEAPALDGSASVEAFLAAHFPTATDTAVTVDDGLADDMVRAKAKTAQALKDATADHDEIKNRVRGLIGNNERLDTPSGRTIATWKHINKLNTKRLAAEHPELVTAYTREVIRAELDVDALKAEHPDIWAAYRTRQLRFTTGD
ncbi:YqaJ viral recombinase family nuclease [Saccharopolyspora pogona]|uniref:YqaJ viral recombinase family nuclease n=1 Tax=Saccharopolyspora pogona TaxID=333966 RepID=UPI0016856CBB|nr:YqaJ viral recombinase family protein [Saccharopolyspora pogona]